MIKDISMREHMLIELHIRSGNKPFYHIRTILIGSLGENVVFVRGCATKALNFIGEEPKIISVVPEKGMSHDNLICKDSCVLLLTQILRPVIAIELNILPFNDLLRTIGCVNR